MECKTDEQWKGKVPMLSEGSGPSVPLEGIPVSLGSTGELLDGLFINIPDGAFSRDAAPVVDDPDTEANVIHDISYEGDDLFKFSYWNERSNRDVVVFRCLSDTCPLRVYVARMEESSYFQIWTASLTHSCPVEIRGQFHRQATTSVISEIIRSRYVGAT
ncbi:unnamed protein product [Microthlaspi erraticum]|uniref:Uncharacterized protein n=1 Tax=Microthlaspi erraticum TaxID=1685480 RepID=A0A6D2HG74_9BRAS|nr:unnamed protein product [Microthlaspi erraticum]